MGGDPFGQAILDYAHNLLAGTSLLRLERDRDVELCDSEVLIKLADSVRPAGREKTRGEHGLRSDYNGQILVRRLRQYLLRQGSAPRQPSPPLEPARNGLEVLGRLASLAPPDRGILQFLVALNHSRRLADVTTLFGDLTLADAATLVAVATCAPVSHVLHSLAPDGPLGASGLVTVDSDRTDLRNKVHLKADLVDLICVPGLDREHVLARFLPEAQAPSLCRVDFAHLADAVEISQELLDAALRSRRRGMNILFHGPTGTGKTELAKLLARRLRVKLYAVGKADDEGESAHALMRLSSLRLANQLVGKNRAVLLFDELEDLFEWKWHGLFGNEKHGTAQMSKQWFNDILERNATPTIWITNETHGVDPAFLRRFAYAIEFSPLGARQRARVLRRHLGRKSRLTAADVDAVAERFTASPAQIGSAVSAARLLAADRRPTRRSLERVLAPIEKLVTGHDPAKRMLFDADAFRVDVVNCATDLADVAERLTAWKPGAGPGLSLCLYGPPGTGKSEYVKYLAHRMGRRVVYRRASDIESCWVGETEKNIAAAFREADEDDAVLLFDEVDSFLTDRKTALRSWEVTRTNEFLQQLERFRGVVACTTNLWSGLDEAALRRFVFKLEFRFLRTEQAITLLRATCERELGTPLSRDDERQARSALGPLANLAPGDFAAALRQTRALGRKVAPCDLVALLVAETGVKRAAGRTIGF